MKKIFLFMVIFGLAFVGVQKVEALDIPCLKIQGSFYKIALKDYTPSETEKGEEKLSNDSSFWQIADWQKATDMTSCGTWDEDKCNFNSCEGIFEFHRDMAGKDVLGLYWVKKPNPTTPIGNPIVLQSTVDTKQEVKICFINKDIKEASYETSEGGNGDFEFMKEESADTCLGMKTGFYLAPKAGTKLNFSSPGIKTVKISGKDFCGVSATDASVNITVKDPCDAVSSPTIPPLTVSSKPARLNQEVTVSFGGNPNIETASYTTSDGQTGSFNRDTNGIFTAIPKFSTSGKKTITVNAVNSCQKKASPQSVDVMVCGDNIGFSIDGNKVYFGDGKKYFSTGYDPAPKDSDLVLFDINRTILVRESATKHLVSFDYTIDPPNTQIKVKISDKFGEIQTPFAEFDVQSSGSYSDAILPHDGLYDILIEATDQCGTYQKVFSVQFQRP